MLCYVMLCYISENFRWISAEKLYKVGLNLAEKYKSRQNTATPNISRIFGLAGFVLKKVGWEV